MDFSNRAFLLSFIIFLLIIVAAAIVILSFVIDKKHTNRFKKVIKKHSTTIRVYTINPQTNVVTFFDQSKIKNKRTCSLNDFLLSFHPDDFDKVKNWITSITLGKKVDRYLEADAIIFGKEPYFTLLELIQYDPKVGLIHLQSHVMKYIIPKYITPRKKKGAPVGVLTNKEMEDLFENRKTSSGYTFSIRFFYLRPQVSISDKIERLILLSLKNQVFPFVSDPRSPRQVLMPNDNEMLLFDLNMSEKESAMQLANSIEYKIKETMELNGYQKVVNFAIGIVENSQYFHEFDAIIDHAQQASMYAQQNNVYTYLYSRSTFKPVIDARKNIHQIEELFKPNALRILYRPIIDITNRDYMGYFDYVKAYDAPFTSFAEMSHYAERAGKNKQLFAAVSKEVINKYANESGGKYPLFFPVSMLDLRYLFEIFDQIPAAQNIKIVLVFEEYDLDQNERDNTAIKEQLAKIKERGYSLALSFRDKDLILDSSLYNFFDMFIVAGQMAGEVKKSNLVRLSIHTLIEQLMHYQKPIIATDLDSWSTVELIIKSGINILSSEAISASSDMILPIDKKRLERLFLLEEKYK